jgi:hypothetical protein
VSKRESALQARVASQRVQAVVGSESALQRVAASDVGSSSKRERVAACCYYCLERFTCCNTLQHAATEFLLLPATRCNELLLLQHAAACYCLERSRCSVLQRRMSHARVASERVQAVVGSERALQSVAASDGACDKYLSRFTCCFTTGSSRKRESVAACCSVGCRMRQVLVTLYLLLYWVLDS